MGSVKVQPVTLAAHGTVTRAAICDDSCAECKPWRDRLREYQRLRDARQKAASHEGKRAQGRMP